MVPRTVRLNFFTITMLALFSGVVGLSLASLTAGTSVGQTNPSPQSWGELARLPQPSAPQHYEWGQTVTELPAKPAPTQSNVPKVSQKYLDATLKSWQHVLQLDDWRAGVIAVYLSDLPDGAAGMSNLDPMYQEIVIKVLRPDQYATIAAKYHKPAKTGKAIVDDIEDTIVHELMHARLHKLSYASPGELQASEELTVVRLTTALLTARYRR